MTSLAMTSPSARRSLMRAEDEPITLKKKACRPVCRRQSVMIERGNPLFADLCPALKKLRDTTLRINRLGLSWSDKESRLSLIVKQRFENTNSRQIMTEEVFKSWVKWSSLKKTKFVVLIKETNDADNIINFFMNSYWAHEKNLNEMEELKRFQGSTFDTIARRKLVEDQDSILELTWQDTGVAEWNPLYEWFERFSRCGISTQWTFPRCQSTCVFPTSFSSWWNAKPFYRNAEPQRWAAKHLGHTWYIGKRFWRSSRVFISTSSAGLESMEFSYITTNSLITGGEEWAPNTSSGSEMPVRTVSQKFSHPQWGRFFKELWSRQIHHANNICLLEDKIQDWGMYLPTFSCGSFVVDQRSGDGWFSGWFKNLRYLQEEFECQNLKYSTRILLQHWTESSIIPVSIKRSVWRNKKVPNEDRFLRGRQIAFLIYEDFWVTGANDSVENYSDLFAIALRNDDIQEFDPKWDEFPWSMTQIPSDDILEGLYK